MFYGITLDYTACGYTDADKREYRRRADAARLVAEKFAYDMLEGEGLLDRPAAYLLMNAIGTANFKLDKPGITKYLTFPLRPTEDFPRVQVRITDRQE